MALLDWSEFKRSIELGLGRVSAENSALLPDCGVHLLQGPDYYSNVFNDFL